MQTKKSQQQLNNNNSTSLQQSVQLDTNIQRSDSKVNLKITSRDIFMQPDDPKNSKPNWKQLINILKKEQKIQKEDFKLIVKQCSKLIAQDPNIYQIQGPVNVIGDIHGQFYDFIKLLDLVGLPSSQNKLLFLGDFVDRGCWSIEVLILVYSLKLNYPCFVYFIRGNHESRQMTSHFNFREEVLEKYDQDVYDYLMDSFDCFPLSALIDNSFICMHGGLGPEMINNYKIIGQINRFTEPPLDGVFCDVLWSDPTQNQQGKVDGSKDFTYNNVRQCSFVFGSKATQQFLDRNHLQSIIRAHEVQLQGYKFHNWTRKKNQLPMVITVFSAPNYCDVHNNQGAFLTINNNKLNIQQFKYTEHPYVVPNFGNALSLTLPFLIDNVNFIMQKIIGGYQKEYITYMDDMEFEINMGRIMNPSSKRASSNEDKTRLKEKKNVFKKKIKSITMFSRYNKILKQNSVLVTSLKQKALDNKLPLGILAGGKQALQDEISKYNQVRLHDMKNEKRPQKQVVIKNTYTQFQSKYSQKQNAKKSLVVKNIK